MRSICVVTGTRAEYGLLYWLMKEIQADPELELQVVATGMHLSPEFGLTYRAIELDGFAIDARVEMLLSSDTPVGIAKSIGLGVIGFADALERLKPELLVVLGDRFEVFAAVQAALVARIPVAHIGGGDTTEGAFDEALRHGITKMSHLHFVTNEVALGRVRQLGEDPERIFLVGNPGLDHLRRTALMDRGALERELDFNFRTRNVLVTFHPATLETRSAEDQLRELLTALDRFGPDLGIIITKPNADTDGRALIPLIDDFAAQHPSCMAYQSLGQLRYLSTLSLVDAVVGNSSSGLCEAPSFKKPTVNIGDRQRGRLRAASVLNCEPDAESIRAAILDAFALDCSAVTNPYGDGASSRRIADLLRTCADPRALLKKRFHEVPA